MTDIDRLTIVIACLGLLLIQRIPENPAYKKWGFIYITFDLLLFGVLLTGVLLPVYHILGWFGA